ncbi:MAG: AMP-binding protein [Bacteroidales bacterium]|jgi:long-chain acyl-CoA synthetase|nr:AMP-binding protein [Bacteroidales bacterium]HPY21699.1 AMP-binding protein [Bacteroidales bacterium]HQA92911.1 AMP-binding protein [Bacteroidales bacterium]HQN24702.1 AMP-binding protein [Bacteroidales bacterium]
MKKSVNKLFEESFKKNWDCPALSDYKGLTLNYRDVARRIAKLHIFFESCDIVKGDKIAICGRNQSNWGVAFLAALTYGAVPVPLLHEFKPANIHNLVNHSDSKILIVGNSIWENLNSAEMPDVEAILLMNDVSVVYAKDEKYIQAREHLNEMFGKKYPNSFTPANVKYYEDSPNELAMINYTSGTTGFSKGVMLPYRSLHSNILFAKAVHPQLNNTSNLVSMLPMAHMYGMMFEFLFIMSVGGHTHFLTKLPSPNIILDAMGTIKPDIIIAVPLIIEKIYKRMLAPIINKNRIKLLLNLPVIDQMIQKKILNSIVTAFGGKFKEVIIGGAALNREAEAFFKRINFPFTVGYGMTECAPIIAYAPWDKTKLYSCGKAAPRMEIKIDSKDPKNIPGEIFVRGDNVFLGYYKNKEATDEVLCNGWLKTGDMGVMDSDGYLFLKGRSKTMILGPSGQNIYPEEIESILNNLPYVVEALVVEDKSSLIALIFPDFDQANEEGLTEEQLLEKLQEDIQIANLELPNYCKLAGVEIVPEEFEKTPKRSIKRYIYQRSSAPAESN